MTRTRLSDSCRECEDLGRCPGRPPARDPKVVWVGELAGSAGKLVGEAHIYDPDADGEHYCKVLQAIEWGDGVRVLRMGYYNIKPDGRVLWGQFAPMFRPEDLETLIERAREKGLLGTHI